MYGVYKNGEQHIAVVGIIVGVIFVAQGQSGQNQQQVHKYQFLSRNYMYWAVWMR